jgi:hypothetical protein
MKLTSEQQQLFADWVREKMEHHRCMLCQSNKWKIGELMHPSSELASEELDGVPSHGRAELICKNCGKVLLFAARHIRGWQQDDSSQSAVM